MCQWMRAFYIAFAISLDLTLGLRFWDANAQSKKTDAVVDSVALYAELRLKTQEARAMLERAEIEIGKKNFSKTVELANAAKSLTFVEGLFVWEGQGNPYVDDAFKTRVAGMVLADKAHRKAEEILLDTAGWFRHRRGTVGRKFELDFLHWYRGIIGVYSSVDNLDESGPYFEYHFPSASKRSIIKSISLSDRTLLVNLRANPNEMTKLRHSSATIHLVHPIRTVDKFRSLLDYIWREQKGYFFKEVYKETKRRYSGIDEIVLTLYYPGSSVRTETPIAKFGLSRSAVKLPIGQIAGLGMGPSRIS